MIRDTIIALVIGVVAIMPIDASAHPIISAILIAFGAWYLLVGTNPENGKKRRSARH